MHKHGENDHQPNKLVSKKIYPSPTRIKYDKFGLLHLEMKG